MAENKNTILTQTGAEVQEALNKIIALGLATAEKDGLLSAEDKVKLNNLYVDTALIGRATAPTPAENEDSTQIANTAYVQNVKRKMLSELVVIVNELPTATEQTMGHIYAVPSDDPEAQNTRIEYITVRSGNPGSYTYSWEKIGAVDVPPQEQADWDESDTDSPSYIQNKPTIPAAQVQADWSEADTTKKSFIQNKPSIPAAQVNADWNAGSGVAQILNKPTIPTQLSQLSADSTHRVVTDTEKSSWDGKYTKPSGGIPASDIASGVIPTVPTISTNIQTDKTSDTKTASPKAVYDEVHPAPGTSEPSGGFLPNVVYNLGTITGSRSFAMAAAVSGIVNHYFWTFETGSTAPTITWPAGITSWVVGSAPAIGASKHYEISVLGGVGAYLEV